MKSLIIAAGEGRRLALKKANGLKPLTDLLGLSLIERVILAMRQNGVVDFVVVNGYKGELLARELGDGSRWNVRITHVKNPFWEKGNGTSVIAGFPHFDAQERFILCMADHVFDPSCVAALLSEPFVSSQIALAVDRNFKGVLDLTDATKVSVEEGLARAIGKDIPAYNAVDCGLFIATPSLFNALEEARRQSREGAVTLSDGVRMLASEGKVKACDITGHFWADIDTPADLAKARIGLLDTLIKPGDGIISRVINRKISIPLSRLLVYTPIAPNGITVIKLLLNIVCAVLFLRHNPFWAAMLVQLASIIDGNDGEIAKLRYVSSEKGHAFDQQTDRLGDGLYLAAFTVMVYQMSPFPLKWVALVTGFTAALGFPLFFLIPTKYKIIAGQLPKYWLNSTWANLFFKRDVFRFILFVGCLSKAYLMTLTMLALISFAYECLTIMEDRRLTKHPIASV